MVKYFIIVKQGNVEYAVMDYSMTSASVLRVTSCL